MCQETKMHYKQCNHTTPYHLSTCAYPSYPPPFHFRTVKTIEQYAYCPTCALKPRVFLQPASVIYFQPSLPIVIQQPPPPILIQQPQPRVATLPQITPGPGSHGQPLPVPAGTPSSVHNEFIRGQWQPVTHYGTPNPNPPSNPSGRCGHNIIHGPDPGPLPPGWGAQPNPLPAGGRGYNPAHGYDPGPPPPGDGVVAPFPVQVAAPVLYPAGIPPPPPALVQTPPQPQSVHQPQANAVYSANPTVASPGVNISNNNSQGAAGATRLPDVSSTAAIQGTHSSSSGSLTATSSATSSNFRGTSLTGSSTSTAGSR